MELKNTFFTAAATAAIVFGSPSLVKGQEGDSPKFKSETIVSTQKAEIGATLNETNAISGQYKDFMNYYGNERRVQNMIKKGELIMNSEGVEIAGIKFPSNFTTLADLKDVPGLILGGNVFQNGDFYYFTLDGAEQVKNAGYSVITRGDWEKVIDAVGGDFILLAALFNFPNAGGMSIYNAERNPGPIKDAEFCAIWGFDGRDSKMMLLEKPSIDGTPIKKNYDDGLQDTRFDRNMLEGGKYKTPCTDVLLLLVQRK